MPWAHVKNPQERWARRSVVVKFCYNPTNPLLGILDSRLPHTTQILPIRADMPLARELNASTLGIWEVYSPLSR